MNPRSLDERHVKKQYRKLEVISSQKKNLNQNRDSNLGARNPEVRVSNPGSGSNFSLEIL